VTWHAFSVDVQSGRQYTWLSVEGIGTLVVRFVAVEVKAAKPGVDAEVEIDGSELVPFAALPFGSELTTVVMGVQSVVDVAVCKQSLRR
jgi:hypothetical protein